MMTPLAADSPKLALPAWLAVMVPAPVTESLDRAALVPRAREAQNWRWFSFLFRP
jgi:hypothetical protein